MLRLAGCGGRYLCVLGAGHSMYERLDIVVELHGSNLELHDLRPLCQEGQTYQTV